MFVCISSPLSNSPIKQNQTSRLNSEYPCFAGVLPSCSHGFDWHILANAGGFSQWRTPIIQNSSFLRVQFAV